MGGKRSRTKGHSFEREIANELKEFFPNARRQLEYQISECKGFDIANTEPFFIQCKKFKSYAPISCIKEVQCQEELGDIPALVTAGDRERPVIVLYWDDFKSLLRKNLKK